MRPRFDGPGRLPNFLIVGAMKAGTTSLAAWLNDHPDVFIARGKELHYFDTFHPRGLDWYKAHFAEATREKAVGEATPGYMLEPSTIARMAATVPDARLIALLRHPVDRAWSQYCHMREIGRWNASLEELMTFECESPEAAGYLRLLNRGRYLEQIEHLLEHFPRERLAVYLFDDLRDRPKALFSEVCHFLDIADAIPANVGQTYNPRATVRSRAAARVIRQLPVKLRNRMKRFNWKAAPNPVMPPSDRARLVAYYEPYNEALAAWLGRDLPAWSR
jgi:hypothetical protein